MSSSASDRTPIEMSSLVQRCMDDAHFARAMLSMFAEQAPAMVRDLQSALTTSDSDRAAKVAHAIKGSAANVSAQPFSDLAAAIESRCREGNVGSTTELMNQLNDELARCLSYIDAQK